MQTLLNKKLFAFMIIMFFSRANAQIIYTDVNPDTTITYPSSDTTISNIYLLDLNNDGTKDYQLHTGGANQSCRSCGFSTLLNPRVYATSLDGNAMLDDTAYNAKALEFTDSIQPSSSAWPQGTKQVLRSVDHRLCGNGAPCGFPVFSGLWTNSAEHYLGLKLIVGNNTYFGWARLNVSLSAGIVNPSAKLIIKDYAYNSIPDQSIFAGEGGQGGPLPLTFVGFGAVLKNHEVLLKWATSNELNNKGFNVERSTDGQKFFAIGFIKSKGNTSSISHYNFTDATLKDAANFYRLKQIDYDDNFSYSAVIKINYINTDGYQVVIAPNPFLYSTTISFTIPQAQKVSIMVYDINGRLVKILVNAEMQSGAHQLVWNVKSEKEGIVFPGVYYLKMQTGTIFKTQKVIVIK